MKKINNNITITNSIFSILVQIVTIISGFVIPRLILSNFGSEVNGLISSLTQFLSYITLLEGGITGVVMASLYKPLFNKDNKKINSILLTAQKFYKKISIIFIVYTIILACVYPIVFNTKFSFMYISSMTIILSLKYFIQYMFSLSFKTLLNADRKVYLVSIIQIVLIILDMIIFSISLCFYKNIHLLKFLSGIIYIIQPVVFNIYVRKNYNIDNNAKVDNELINSRWDGFAINIAAFIHNNTDIVVLTFFENLSVVSIYSVYQLVSSGLRKIISSISTAVAPSFGRLIAKGNQEELNRKFDQIEYIYFMVVYFFFSVGIVAVTPFVNLYTKGVNDINYNQPLFGMLLLISEGIFTLRGPYVNLAYSANKFKDMKKHAYIEAILNIIISILLVNYIGLVGVAIGTLIAMSFRTLYQVYYLRDNILYRSLNFFIKKFIIFSCTAFVGCLICNIILRPIYAINKVSSWIIASSISSIIFLFLYIFISLVFFKDDIKYYYKYLKKIVRR